MKTRTLATAALLLGCIALLQYHAIQFWTAHTGPLGVAWSLLLEGAALWLWSDQRAARRTLGGAVTLLLLVGPLYQVSAPLIEDSSRTELTSVASADRSRDLAREITTLENALATYLANSTARQGWVARIDHTQARIEQLRTEQAQLTAERALAPQHQPWQRSAVIAMEALAIVIFQLVAVLCIGELRERQFAQIRKLDADVTTDKTTAQTIAWSASGKQKKTRANFTPATVKPLQAVA